MLFQKLRCKDIFIDLDKVRVQNKNIVGPHFFEYPIDDNLYFRETLNNIFDFTIKPDVINITEITYPGAKAHTDAWNVGLNYYFNLGNDITYYFDEIDSTIEPIRIQGTNVKVFNQNNLKVKDQFVANRNEWYLLNTTVPHAVKCHDPGTIRTMLRFVWYNYNIETIFDSIKIKN